MAIVENGVLTNVISTEVDRLNNGESWKSVFGEDIIGIGGYAFSELTNSRDISLSQV